MYLCRCGTTPKVRPASRTLEVGSCQIQQCRPKAVSQSGRGKVSDSCMAVFPHVHDGQFVLPRPPPPMLLTRISIWASSCLSCGRRGRLDDSWRSSGRLLVAWAVVEREGSVGRTWLQNPTGNLVLYCGCAPNIVRGNVVESICLLAFCI